MSHRPDETNENIENANNETDETAEPAPERRTWLEIFRNSDRSPAGGGWAELLGAEVVEMDEGRAVLEMDCGPQHRHNGGVVQGGIITALADASMGMALMTAQTVGKSNTTIELKINFLRPHVAGILRAEGRVVKTGRTVLYSDSVVTNSEGKIVAKATSSCLQIDSTPPRRKMNS